ncbi:hypothetical protein MMT22_29445, partial [Escherichia coli]|nr:hypothetical protein [Escherichia coli]
PQFTFPVSMLSCLILLRHHDNIQRLWRRQETKIWTKFKRKRDMTHGIWELGNGQEKKSVKVSGHLSSNSGEIVLQWALEGKG